MIQKREKVQIGRPEILQPETRFALLENEFQQFEFRPFQPADLRQRLVPVLRQNPDQRTDPLPALPLQQTGHPVELEDVPVGFQKEVEMTPDAQVAFVQGEKTVAHPRGNHPAGGALHMDLPLFIEDTAAAVVLESFELLLTAHHRERQRADRSRVIGKHPGHIAIQTLDAQMAENFRFSVI